MRDKSESTAANVRPIGAASSDPWMIEPEAARVADVSEYRLRGLALRGEIGWSVVAGRIVYDRDSVQRFRAMSAPRRAA